MSEGCEMDVDGLIPFPLWNRGSWPQRDVAGESHRLNDIRRLFPKTITQSTDYTGIAVLLPEPKNRHDANAVMVWVDGRHIGYLARDEASQFSPVLQGLVAQGWLPTCPCSIWGYEYEDWTTDRRGREVSTTAFRAKARLVLDEPHMCIPLNLPPNQRHAVLPHGSALQVHGEENYLENLRPYTNEHGEGWVHATLHHVEEQLKTTSRTVVELRIDAEPIGHLTPAMSKNYLPVIHHLELQGITTTARAIVKGNSLTAEAVLHAAKAHELDSHWLSENATSVGDPPQTSSEAPASQLAASVIAQDSSVTVGGASASSHALHQPIPTKPTRIVFNPPPGWPPADGNEPPAGWIAPGDWPRAPDGWKYWVAQ